MYSQTPQVVPQAFSNIAKPGYRSGPPATVQQKELVKLKDITKFLSTFSIASESYLNNLRLSRDEQEKLFDQFRATQDGPTLEQIMLQLYQITKQEASKMQFMLDKSRSMSKAYADLVAYFISSPTNLVLLRREAYLCHAHPNLDAFRLHNIKLHSATISQAAWAKYILIHKYSNTFLKYSYSNTFVKNTKYSYSYLNAFQKYSYSWIPLWIHLIFFTFLLYIFYPDWQVLGVNMKFGCLLLCA